MNFWQIFIRVLWWRPLPALGALWWHVTGRRVRARNRLRAAGAPLPFAYKFWMRNVERPQQQILAHRSEAAKSWAARPKFTVIIDAVGRGSDNLNKSLVSLEQQIYPASQIIVVEADQSPADPHSSHVQSVASRKDALKKSDGDFLIPLTAGDQLSSWALCSYADQLQSSPAAAILYGDQDELDEAGTRRRPWFKPRWNEELFLARDYLSRACAIRVSPLRAAEQNLTLEEDTWILDLLLEVVAQHTGTVVHIPKVVTHVRDPEAQPSQLSRIQSVKRFVAPRGANAVPGPFGSVKVAWPLPEPMPLVSIIVPTRDKLELLRPCINSILARTSYGRFELMVVDNRSVESRTHRYLEELRAYPNVQVLPYDRPYNYSAINNHAARHANGSFVCLLNNDTEVVEADWLSEMMRYATRPGIGAVGAKLLYADGSIQHAGVIVGIGDAAGHAHRKLPKGDIGYFGYAHAPQFVTAVTGACLLVDKRKFLAVGGLDEELLPIAYNDVDLCLKLERSGLRNVYVPHAVLIHYESKSRANDHAPSRIDAYKRELQAFQERWATKGYNDPLLNPNLDPLSETFLIRF